MRLTPEEAEDIKDQIFNYVDELEEDEKDDYSFVWFLMIPGDNRFLEISVIINKFEGQVMFFPLSISEINQDEYLDQLSSQR